MQHASIKFRLSLAFYLFLFLVIFLGVFDILCLNAFNEVADQIRNRWLPNTRFLGDLNNYTSDFRAAEGTLLLAAGEADIAASEQEFAELDRNIAKARWGYEQIHHDSKEAELYRQFFTAWESYRNLANQVLELTRAGKKENGIAIYKTGSLKSYNTASDMLGYLTDLNVAEDQEASGRSVEMYHKVRMLTLATIMAGILMMVVVVLYIRRSISAPMLNFANIMHQLADNDTNVEITGMQRHDEIGEMARALTVFRNNAIDLMLSRQGLAKQASMLEEKLEHERKLMDAQRNFISMISHEFRTPLNIIDGHAQRLARTREDANMDDVADRTTKIRHAVKQIIGLIDNLNATRLFDGTPELYFHPTEVEFSALLHELCSQHREVVSGAQIMERFDHTLLTISGDPKLLQQLFSNLLSNAIKYSPNGGVIEVGVIRNPDHVTVTIQDHGVGIPEKDLDAIFGRYTRGSNVSDISGTGIGLYLAQIITGLHKGRIMVESIEGEGAKFTVQLPI